jgi:sulfite exporter TauE/SafE
MIFTHKGRNNPIEALDDLKILVNKKEIQIDINDLNVIIRSNKELNIENIEKISKSLKDFLKTIRVKNKIKQSNKQRSIEIMGLILGIIGCVLTIVFGIIPWFYS